jgi:hypothetical protein
VPLTKRRRADAATIAEQYSPFAVLGGPALTSAFGDELAARQVLCISCTRGQPANFYTDRDHTSGVSTRARCRSRRTCSEFIEKQMIGKNAEHGGDAVKALPRSFGLVYLESSGARRTFADKFAAAMDTMGSPLAAVAAYQLDPATIQQTASQVITKMKAAGVTTIVFSGDPVAPRDFTNEATAQEYFPEWVVAASTLVDVTAFARTYDQQQWAHAFGVTQLAARSNPTTSGAYANYEWFTGVEPPANDSIGVIAPSPALFFAVVQGVGPNLSPETFRDTLFAAEGTRPGISQPYLSYGDKGYWGGVATIRASTTPLRSGGILSHGPRRDPPKHWHVQYVDGGLRYLSGQWPTDDKMFDPAGAVAITRQHPLEKSVATTPSPG